MREVNERSLSIRVAATFAPHLVRFRNLDIYLLFVLRGVVLLGNCLHLDTCAFMFYAATPAQAVYVGAQEAPLRRTFAADKQRFFPPDMTVHRTCHVGSHFRLSVSIFFGH